MAFGTTSKSSPHDRDESNCEPDESESDDCQDGENDAHMLSVRLISIASKKALPTIATVL